MWRISPAGDWTNAGRVSYSVDIWTSKEEFPQHTAKAKIGQGESHVYIFDVPVGTAALETRLVWMNMNGNYPISDVTSTCSCRRRRTATSFRSRRRRTEP